MGSHAAQQQEGSDSLAGRPVFLSASIPDPARWTGHFDAREITDASVAAARAILTADGVIITAAHPTIAPLLLYVAAELAPHRLSPPVVVYQSRLFTEVLPEPTRRFEDEGIGELRWTPAVENEAPDPDHRHESLRVMREQMLRDTSPVAAVFVGGMSGISDEFALFRDLFPTRSTYPIGAAGGEARALVPLVESHIDGLLDDAVYPALFRRVIADIIGGLDTDAS